MKVKVLRCPRRSGDQQRWPWYFKDSFAPVFNRDGLYLRGKDCWFELDGVAYPYCERSFREQLQDLDAPALLKEDYLALLAIKRRHPTLLVGINRALRVCARRLAVRTDRRWHRKLMREQRKHLGLGKQESDPLPNATQSPGADHET